jgi:hypothetical protein
MLTHETKFMARSEDSRETQLLLQLLMDSYGGNEVSPPRPINGDHQSALTVLTTGIIEIQTKHINVSCHNCLDLHRRRIVNYSYMHTNENVAAILT